MEQTRHSLDMSSKKRRRSFTQGDELPAGALKMIKVYLAVKRRFAAR
jgi:DNA-directed RNA polymerase subunit beta